MELGGGREGGGEVNFLCWNFHQECIKFATSIHLFKFATHSDYVSRQRCPANYVPEMAWGFNRTECSDFDQIYNGVFQFRL